MKTHAESLPSGIRIHDEGDELSWRPRDSLGNDSNIISSAQSVAGHLSGRVNRAMTGEAELWKRVAAERISWKGELDSSTQIVSEISRNTVAPCRGGSFHLRRRGESGRGTAREHALPFERK